MPDPLWLDADRTALRLAELAGAIEATLDALGVVEGRAEAERVTARLNVLCAQQYNLMDRRLAWIEKQALALEAGDRPDYEN